MKIFKVIFEDYNGVYREYIPARDEKSVIDEYGCNGDIVLIEDVTEDYPISIEIVRNTLQKNCFGKAEIDIITRILQHSLSNII